MDPGKKKKKPDRLSGSGVPGPFSCFWIAALSWTLATSLFLYLVTWSSQCVETQNLQIPEITRTHWRNEMKQPPTCFMGATRRMSLLNICNKFFHCWSLFFLWSWASQKREWLWAMIILLSTQSFREIHTAPASHRSYEGGVQHSHRESRILML